MMNRPVITGIGVVLPGCESTNQIIEKINKNEIGTQFNTFTEWNVKGYLEEKGLRYIPKSSQYAIVAVKKALNDAALKIDEENEKNVGIIFGSAFGNVTAIHSFYRDAITEGPRYVNPYSFPNIMPTTLCGLISIQIKAKAICKVITSGKSSGFKSLAYAAQEILSEKADVIVAGVTEENSEFLKYYLPQKAYNKETGEDKKMHTSEGSIAFIIESEKHAKKRGVVPVLEIENFGKINLSEFIVSEDDRIKEIFLNEKHSKNHIYCYCRETSSEKELTIKSYQEEQKKKNISINEMSSLEYFMNVFHFLAIPGMRSAWQTKSNSPNNTIVGTCLEFVGKRSANYMTFKR